MAIERNFDEILSDSLRATLIIAGFDSLERLVRSFPNLEKVVWAQEEPKNQGALFYIGPRLRAVVPRNIPLKPVARPDRASPAEGKAQDHLKEQKRIVEEALGLREG